MTSRRFSSWQIGTLAAVAIAFALAIWILAPILTPFLIAAILAYVLDPIVERLSGRLIGRTLAVTLVLAIVLAASIGFALIVLPLLYKELRMLSDRLPEILALINARFVPWFASVTGIELQLDIENVKRLASELIADNRDVVSRLLDSLKVGGVALVAFFANLLLVPVVLFYLLRDWRLLLQRIGRLIPRRIEARTRALFGEVDAVLAEFLRGQVLVIMIMSAYYIIALWLTGLEFALPVGLITGVLVFIPYVGALSGLVLGSLAALLQFGSLAGLLWVWLAFAIGQALEGMVVTPLFVGERIGLHPVAVIFALLAFGQVFGFFGVLLALPASAALLVAIRGLKRVYLESALFHGDRRG